MPSLEKVIIEAAFVGVMLIPVAYIAGYIAKMFVQKPSLPEICSTWNENYIMEVNLFIAGFLFHILGEFFGLNKWYVQQYVH